MAKKFSLLKKPFRIRMQTSNLIVSVGMVVCVLVAISIISYQNSVAMMNGSVDEIKRSELFQINKKLEFNLTEIRNIAQVIANDDALIEDLKSYEVSLANNDKFQILQITRNIEASLSELKLHDKNVESIVVLTDDAVYTTGATTFYNVRYQNVVNSTAIYSVLKSSDSPRLFELDASVHQDLIVPTVHTSLNVLLSQVSYGSLLVRNGVEYGCVFVIAKKSMLDNIFNGKKDIAIYNTDNHIAWSNTTLLTNETRLGSSQATSGDISRISIDSKGQSLDGFSVNTFVNGWKILYLKNIDDFKNQMENLQRIMLLVLLLCLFLTFPLSKFLLDGTMRLVRELVRRLREFKGSDDNSVYPIDLAARSRVSLRTKFIFYFLAVLFIPVSLFTALYHFGSIRIMESEIEKSIRVNFDQMQENLVSLLQQNDTIGRSILYDRTVQQFMSAPEEMRSDSNEIFRKLNEKMEVGQYYSQISVYDIENRLILSNINGQDTYLDVALSDRLSATKGETLWVGPTLNEYQRWYVYALIQIQYLNDQGLAISKTIGYARMGVEEAYLEQMYRSSLSDGVDIYIEDENGTIVSHIDKKQIGTTADAEVNGSTRSSGSGNYLLLKEPIANTPWYLVEKYSYDRIQSESSRLLIVNIYYTLAIILFMTFLIWFFSYLFVRPLNRFRSMIETTGVDDSFESISADSSYSEIHELVGAYNGMVERIENLIDEVLIAKMARRELEGQKKELELIALQGQINPHFLCNTLETIKWTIYDRDVKKAVVMIDSLNNLFKYGISRIENVITIEQEVRYAQSYTEIVQLRNSSKIDFEWDIDDALLQRKTIKLILQPIIENAIHHGLETRKKGGHVLIRCRLEDEEIVFTVQDDGIGLSPEKLEQIRNKLDDRHANHIGLNNVHARIKIYFGEAYGLTIDSTPGHGTTVCIRLPKID